MSQLVKCKRPVQARRSAAIMGGLDSPAANEAGAKYRDVRAC